MRLRFTKPNPSGGILRSGLHCVERNVRNAVLLAALTCFGQWRGGLGFAAEVNENSSTPPYPPSDMQMTWHWDTLQTAAIGSDLWPTTWGPDDHIYVAWGDGGGFGGSDSDGRASLGFGRLEGSPEHFKGVNLNGGKDSSHPASYPKKGKCNGLLYDHGTLYAAINLQDGVWPDVNHVLAWSKDNAATWTNANWLFPKGRGSFEPAKFINFGRNGSGVPPRFAGYIYYIGPTFETTATGRGTNLYLARVPRKKITEKDAIEFFAGTDRKGRPAWRASFDFAKPVFKDTNGVAPGSIAYNPALKRFLLACFHTGPGQLGIFDAPEPWGPWTTLGYYDDWGNMGRAGEGLGCEFPSKWMSSDGLTLWSVFAVYGDGAKQGINAHDRFNLVKATIESKSRPRDDRN